MPNNATRKCHMKRSNATRKLAAERRKLSEQALALTKKMGQVLLDTMHGQFKKAEKMLTKNSPLRKIMDVEQFAKLLSTGYLMNQQFKHLPPMSAEQEKQLIEALPEKLKNQGRRRVEIQTSRDAPVTVEAPSYILHNKAMMA